MKPRLLFAKVISGIDTHPPVISTTIFFPSSVVANMPELPFPAPEPHPKETIEMILKTMEKIPGDAPLDSQTRLADIGFVREDFKPFEM
jgi:hypothetical protein